MYLANVKLMLCYLYLFLFYIFAQRELFVFIFGRDLIATAVAKYSHPYMGYIYFPADSPQH